MNREGTHFQKKLLIFKVPLIFENESFAARAAYFANFLELSS